MTAQPVEASLRSAARFAGLLFLLSLFVPLLNWVFVLSTFSAAASPLEAARTVLANETLYRFGIINDLATAVIAVALTLVLYVLLKNVGRNVALLALFLKMTEAVLIAVGAFCSFVALLMLKGQVAAADPDLLQSMVGLFLTTRMPAAAIPMLFLGMNLVLFLSLLYRSNFVPRTLAAFGVLSYALIFIYAVLTIIAPNIASILAIQAASWAPSCLFELIIGVWLLAKGLRR